MQKEKNYGWALDSARKNPYNSCVAHPGVAQLVARMVRDHEAVGSNPATRTTGNPWGCKAPRVFGVFGGEFSLMFSLTGRKRSV